MKLCSQFKWWMMVFILYSTQLFGSLHIPLEPIVNRFYLALSNKVFWTQLLVWDFSLTVWWWRRPRRRRRHWRYNLLFYCAELAILHCRPCFFYFVLIVFIFYCCRIEITLFHRPGQNMIQTNECENRTRKHKKTIDKWLCRHFLLEI